MLCLSLKPTLHVIKSISLFTAQRFLGRAHYYHSYLMCSFYFHQNNRVKMGPSLILSIIHNITIGTMLNFNSGNNVNGPKDVRCKQTLKRQTACGMNGIHFTNKSVKQKRETYLDFVLLLLMLH